MKIQETVGERKRVWRVVERDNSKKKKKTGITLGMTETNYSYRK